MSLKKYVKDNIYGLPENMIGNDEINGFKYCMAKENPDYLNDILSEIDAFELVEAVVNGGAGMSREIRSIKALAAYKLKKEILNFIGEIREDEESEEEDHGMKPTDFLMGKL